MHSFRFGIEEEYFLVNRQTGTLKCELPKAFMAAAQRKLGKQLTTELLQSQIEVAPPPLLRSEDAHAALSSYRSILTEVGKEHGVGILAAGTHPQAQPHEQRMTKKRRYSKVISDLGMVGLGTNQRVARPCRGARARCAGRDHAPLDAVSPIVACPVDLLAVLVRLSNWPVGLS
jgi:gamma-glutamyl:cysteine ligase YbdK (ATP-grasp superfamily)